MINVHLLTIDPLIEDAPPKEALKKAHKVCEKHGVPLAQFLYPPFSESVPAAVADGARVLVAGGDVSLLFSAAKSLTDALG